MQRTANARTQISVVEKLGVAPGKQALITGASKAALGLKLPNWLAAQKVNLVLAARRAEPMEKLASDLRRKYGVDIHIEPIENLARK